MKKIRYFVDYDIDNFKNENRKYSMAAKYKVDYIISVLNDLGYNVEIVSNAYTTNRKGIYTSRKTVINENVTLVQGWSFAANNRITRVLRRVLQRIWLFRWMMKNIVKNEQYIVYHDLSSIKVHLKARKIKHSTEVLELEELYYKFGLCSSKSEKIEKQMIISADKYIMSNCNFTFEFPEINDRKNCIIHGAYKTYYSDSERDKHIIAFAGGIDSIRNSAMNALNVVKELGSPYRLLIAGYGKNEEINKLKRCISAANSEAGYNVCEYCGTLYGEKLDLFYIKASVALNLQNGHDYYMDYAFPSKLIAYLGHGLPVISTNIKTISDSCIRDCIKCVNIDDKKECISEIKKIIETEHTDPRALIEQLNISFHEDLNKLLL